MAETESLLFCPHAVLRLWYFVVNMYVLFEIVFAVFDYYCFEGHRED
jgi:hypothetical protein